MPGFSSALRAEEPAKYAGAPGLQGKYGRLRFAKMGRSMLRPYEERLRKLVTAFQAICFQKAESRAVSSESLRAFQRRKWSVLR